MKRKNNCFNLPKWKNIVLKISLKLSLISTGGALYSAKIRVGVSIYCPYLNKGEQCYPTFQANTWLKELDNHTKFVCG
jgi:hypothetical protein